MPEEVFTQSVVRVVRPYPSEDEYLAREQDTLTRTSAILLGADARPPGVVIRFEVLLAGGQVVLRGEGRVVGYRPRAQGNEPGLALRFTRLDAPSKALLERAAERREQRARPIEMAPPTLPEPSEISGATEYEAESDPEPRFTLVGPPKTSPPPASIEGAWSNLDAEVSTRSLEPSLPAPRETVPPPLATSAIEATPRPAEVTSGRVGLTDRPPPFVPNGALPPLAKGASLSVAPPSVRVPSSWPPREADPSDGVPVDRDALLARLRQRVNPQG